MRWRCRERVVDFPRRALVMATLLPGPDPEATLADVAALIEAGADLLALPPRAPDAHPAPRDILRLLAGTPPSRIAPPDLDPDQIFPPLLCADAPRPAEARAALDAGADLLRLPDAPVDPDTARACAASGAAILLTRHASPGDITAFARRIDEARAAGIDERAIAIDPAPDLAAHAPDAIEIVRHTGDLLPLGRPILASTARGHVLDEILDARDATAREAGAIALLVAALLRGARILHARQVATATAAARVFHALESAGESGAPPPQTRAGIPPHGPIRSDISLSPAPTENRGT